MFNLSNYSTTCIYHTHVLMGLLLKKWHSLTHFTTFFCASSTLRTAERSWDPIWMSTPSIIRFSVLSFQPPTGKEGLTNSSKVFFSVLSAWLGNDISFLSPQTWPSPPRSLHKDWGQSARVWVVVEISTERWDLINLSALSKRRQIDRSVDVVMDHEQAIAASASSPGSTGIAIHSRNYSSCEDYHLSLCFGFSYAFSCLLIITSGSAHLSGNRAFVDCQGRIFIHLGVCLSV